MEINLGGEPSAGKGLVTHTKGLPPKTYQQE